MGVVTMGCVTGVAAGQARDPNGFAPSRGRAPGPLFPWRRRRVPSVRMSESQYDKSARVELADEAVHWDLGSSLSYGQYLQLDKLLAAQQPLSEGHHELRVI